MRLLLITVLTSIIKAIAQQRQFDDIPSDCVEHFRVLFYESHKLQATKFKKFMFILAENVRKYLAPGTLRKSDRDCIRAIALTSSAVLFNACVG